jgi:uncharacterized protein YndB with AHSA1/START domain
MEATEKTTITVQAVIMAPVEKVWKCWTTPEDIVRWNAASDDWHTSQAANDLRIGGRFNYRMESRDGSTGFDFEGIYDNVVFQKKIEYTLGDGRKVRIAFSRLGRKTIFVESFEAENIHSIDLQTDGWQAILDNFKKYAEAC